MIRIQQNKGLTSKYPTLVIYENQNAPQQNTSPWNSINHNTNNIKHKNKNFDREFPIFCVIKN